MKTTTIMMAGVAVVLVCSAQAKKPGKDGPRRELPPEIIKRFDKDGDGKLNKEEMAAAKAAREERMKAQKEEMLKKFDKDGDGKLSEEERKAMHEELKKRAIEKFDKDGDGELNEEERAEMRKEWGDMPGPRDKKGHKGKRDEREPGGDEEAPGVLGE
jgi:Ca2+-binding EF-hand superfamily protein